MSEICVQSCASSLIIDSEILGWLTVVVDARLLYDVVATSEGLGRTGQVLIVGPPTSDNLFPQDVTEQTSAQNANVPVWFVLPPQSNSTLGYRHNLRAYGTGNPDLTFTMASYPSVLEAWSASNTEINNAGSHISTHNEEGKRVSTGYAQVNSDLVDWVVVFEQSYGEVVHPIVQFRNIVLICVFSKCLQDATHGRLTEFCRCGGCYHCSLFPNRPLCRHPYQKTSSSNLEKHCNIRNRAFPFDRLIVQT